MQKNRDEIQVHVVRNLDTIYERTLLIIIFNLKMELKSHSFYDVGINDSIAARQSGKYYLVYVAESPTLFSFLLSLQIAIRLDSLRKLREISTILSNYSYKSFSPLNILTGFVNGLLIEQLEKRPCSNIIAVNKSK